MKGQIKNGGNSGKYEVKPSITLHWKNRLANASSAANASRYMQA